MGLGVLWVWVCLSFWVFCGLVVVSPRLGFGGDLDGLAFYCLGLVGG